MRQELQSGGDLLTVPRPRRCFASSIAPWGEEQSPAELLRERGAAGDSATRQAPPPGLSAVTREGAGVSRGPNASAFFVSPPPFFVLFCF